MNNDLRKILEAAEISGQRFCFNLSSRFLGSQGGGRFGNRTGQSLEFVEHREYQPGDDIRHLDWSAAARSDKLAIKLFREEITPHIDIFIDLSASMATYSSKTNALTALVAILNKASVNSAFSCDNWLVKDICRRVEPASLPIEKWPDFIADYKGNTGNTLGDFPPKLRNGAVRLIISDLFWNQEPVRILSKLSDGAAATVVIQMVAQNDITPDIYGNMRVIDSESGEALELICDDALLAEYKANFERHRQYWKECCTKTGALFCFMTAEDFLKDYMPDELIKNEILISRG